MFEEALDIAHEDVTRCLELMWMRFVDDIHHYNSSITPVIPGDFKPSGSSSTASPSGRSTPHHHGHQAHGYQDLATNREFWVNMRTSMSQWTRPFRKKLFRSQDLEMEYFIAIVIRHDIFPKRFGLIRIPSMHRDSYISLITPVCFLFIFLF